MPTQWKPISKCNPLIYLGLPLIASLRCDVVIYVRKRLKMIQDTEIP
jgi:hypothetical protein